MTAYTVKVVKPDHRYEFIQVKASSPMLAALQAKSTGVPVYACEGDLVVWQNTDPEERKFLESAR